MKLIHKLITRISYSYQNYNRLMSQTINSLVDKMNGKNTAKHVIEDNVSDQQITKRHKTEDNSSSDEVNEEVVVKKAPIKREKLRKWVLLLSYCGQNYYGMQRQIKSDEEFPTIELRLFESLLKSGVIDDFKFKGQHICRFQRAARTDRGVSAIKQICSILLPNEFKDLLPKINELLPPEIRLMDCLRVTKHFDAKNFCDARTYSYLMPSYALCPIEENTTETFRLSKDKLKEFNDILSLYLGTRNYHNFTSGKTATDASAMRYIISMDCSQPFLKGDLEFVVIRVKGQAFMLHQIRKMIGLAIAVMRGITEKDTIMKAFDTTRIDIPKAPGLGLLLEEVHYDQYNKKYGGDGVHQPITWEEKNEVIDEFKHKHIYPVIVETETKDKPMFEWLQTLHFHTYSERAQGANDDPNQSEPTSGSPPILKAHLKVIMNDKLKNNSKEGKVTKVEEVEEEVIEEVKIV